LSRQTTKVWRPGVSMAVTGRPLDLAQATKLRFRVMRPSDTPHATQRRRRSAFLAASGVMLGMRSSVVPPTSAALMPATQENWSG